MFLSIIIPCYNAKAYIGKCLNSIWDEGLLEDEYEVICIDDCSTDDTLLHLYELQKLHNNMQVLRNCENLRAGGARNHGVKNSCGKYILFIDADDYIHPGGLRQAINHLKKQNIDLLKIDHVRDIMNGKIGTKMIHYNTNQQVISGKVFATNCLVPFSPCGYIFKRSLMVENGIWFAERVTGEDIDWSFHMLLKAKTAQYLPIILSHIVIVPNSVTGTQHASVKTVFDTMKTGKRLMLLSNEYQNDPSITRLLHAVARICYERGVKQMLTVKCWKQKQTAIQTLLPQNIDTPNNCFSESYLISFIQKHPILFSIASDCVAPLVKLLVSLKRKVRGRINVN